jgi:RNA polymerase sigma factor (sigma-70 family)
MKTDSELLKEYHRKQSQAAFRDLIERHADLVHAAAARAMGDADLAQDAAQQVFLLLAKNAGRLYAGTGLVGWLHRTTVLTCCNLRRKESRRQKLMKDYSDHQLSGVPTAAASLPRLIVAQLDDAISRLGEKDRAVVIGHFLEGRTYQEIAEQAESTEAAVQKRASRAVGKLASWLKGRKLAISATALLQGMAGMKAEASALPLPRGLVDELASGSLSGLKSLSWTAVWGHRWREMLMFGKRKFAFALLAASLPLGLGAGGFYAGRFLGLVSRGAATLGADQRAAIASQQALLAAHPPAVVPHAARSVAQIVEAAATHYLDEGDPVGANRAAILLREITAAQVPEALAYLGDRIHEKNAISAEMVPTLLRKWAPAVVRDQAARWVMEHSPKASAWLADAIKPWAQQEALVARDWWRTQPGASRDQFLFNAIYREFNSAQTAALWEELPTLSVAEEQAACFRIGEEMRVVDSREAVFQRIREVPEEALRYKLCCATAGVLGSTDPEAALAWARQLPLSDQGLIMEIRADLGKSVGVTHPAQWTAMMLETVPAALREKFKASLK